MGGDRDGELLLSLCEDLEEQVSSAAVRFAVAGFVLDEQVDAAVAGDGRGQPFVVGGHRSVGIRASAAARRAAG